MQRAHIYREYHTEPYLRFAMTVVEDPKADHGYRIEDNDLSVADGAFLHTFHTHMSRPLETGESTQEGAVSVLGRVVLYPGDEDFFDDATRKVPGALRGAKGRS